MFKKLFKRDKTQTPEAVDLRGAEFFQDPYPTYKILREHRPVAPVTAGGYLLTRHEDVYLAFSSGEFGNAPSRFSVLHPRNKEKYVAAEMTGNMLPYLDQPEHIRPRRILAKTFHGAFKEFAPELVEIAEAFAQQAHNVGKMEIIHGMAELYSLSSMCRFLGAPEEDAKKLKPLCESFFYLFAPLNDPKRFVELNGQMVTFRHYFRDLVQKRQKNSQNDLISKLLDAEHEGEKLSVDEIVDNCILLFADGVENIQYAIGNILALFKHYDVNFHRLSEDEKYLKNVMGEVLRIDPPAQIIPRIVLSDCELHGISLKAQTPLFLAIGGANRDETVFDQPDRFDTERNVAKLLSFGAGRHSCIGGMMGTMQLTNIVRSLAARGVKVESHHQDMSYHHRFGHRWPKEVYISF